MLEPVQAFHPGTSEPETEKPVSIRRMYLTTAMVWLAAVMSISLAVPGHAASTDFLEMPALQSEHAQNSVLMDVTNNGKRIVAVGERGIIIHSSDNGKTWQQSEVPTYATLTAVHFPTADEGWAVGHEGVVLHTSDGGLSWQKQFDGREANAQLIISLEKRIAQVQQKLEQQNTPELLDELDLLQIQLEDEQIAADEGPSKPFLDVWFRNADEGYVVGAYGLIFRTNNGGNSWHPWFSHVDNPDGFHLNAITRAGNTLYIAGEMGLIWRSDINGTQFSAAKTDYEGSFFNLVADSGNNSVIALGLKGTAFRSVDKGVSWQRLETRFPVTLSAGTQLPNGRNVIVGYGGAVLTGSNDRFTPYRRKDMMTALGVTAVNSDHLILVGIGGIRHAHGNGSKLEIAE